ncbi:MAG TPA: hypothetical protein VFZ66_10665 [Herpetosiphonaceae bacterium]
MDDNVPRNQVVLTPQLDDAQLLRQQIRGRYYRALNYLSIYLFIIVVYGSGLIVDYLLFSLMWWLLDEEVQRYYLVATGFDYARIGLAMLFIVSAIVHGSLSTYSQIQLDIALFKEGNEAR